MKRKQSNEDGDYNGSSESEAEFIQSENDADFLKNSDIIFLVSPEKNNKKKQNKPKRKKTKRDIEREEIQKEIDKINSSGKEGNTTDKILFSNLPIEKKASIIQELERYLGNDRAKFMGYIDKVLAIPFGVFNTFTDGFLNPTECLLKLRQSMDNSIFGHYDTKEEIIDYISSIIRNPSAKGNILALQSSPGMGKCHAKDTPILMYDGSVKMIQNLEIGDEIMGDNSTPRTIMTLGKGKDLMYEIHHQFSNIKYIVNKEHILCLSRPDGAIVEIAVKDFVKKPLEFQIEHYGYTNAINFITKKTKLDPYLQGTLLDITEEYKINSFRVRLDFLKGVIDTYGIRNPNNIQILLPDRKHIEDILFMSRSLGFTTSHSIVSNVNIITIQGERLVYLKYPCLYNKFSSKEPIVVTELEVDDYYGITIDGNNRYVMGNMVVTHNTKFVRALGNSLGLPFNQISLGGISDPAILVGHDYTYVSSKPGRIYDALARSKCMNPIIYLDECDKIPEHKAVELNGILTHLLDKEQNMDFKDNYLGDISLDLSKVLFILSFNDPTAIDPVVFNRLKVIKIKENTIKEKVEIVKKFTIKEICENLGLDVQKFIITDDTIKNVITKTHKEPGMREITRNFETIFNKINTKMLLEKSSNSKLVTEGFSGTKSKLVYNKNKQIIINNDFVNNYIKHEELLIHHFMYL